MRSIEVKAHNKFVEQADELQQEEIEENFCENWRRSNRQFKWEEELAEEPASVQEESETDQLEHWLKASSSEDIKLENQGPLTVDEQVRLMKIRKTQIKQKSSRSCWGRSKDLQPMKQKQRYKRCKRRRLKLQSQTRKKVILKTVQERYDRSLKNSDRLWVKSHCCYFHFRTVDGAFWS